MPDAIRVLHVDDDPSQLQVAKLILERADPHLHVDTAEDPRDALHRITQEPVDCIVTDYRMPNLNGIELATKIREHTDAPIILYTGQGSEQIAEEAFAVGVDDYIRKEPEPSHYQVLARRIRVAVEKHRAEAELQVSEANYRNVVEHANQGIIVIQDGLLKFANNRLTEMTGYTHEELIGTPFIDHLHPDDRNEALEQYRNRDPSGTTFYPFRIIAKDGGLLWIEVNGIGIDWGGSEATLHFITDVTERRLAEEKIRERETIFRDLAEKSPSMIFINRGGRVLYANRLCEEQMGYTREEFYSPDFNFMSMIAPESLETIRENYQRHLSGEEVPPYEYALIRKDGSRLDAIISTKLISYRGDTSILGIVTDISERKEMEKSLQDSEERYRTFLDSSRDAVYVLDDTQYLYVNKSGADLLGYADPEELIGQSPFQHISPKDRERVENMVITRQRGEEVPNRYEFRLIRKDGEEINVETHVSLIDYEGRPASLAVNRDITKQKRMEAELKEANLTLEGLVEEKTRELLDAERLVTAGRIAATVGHDLRGPLQTIKNAIYLMRQSPESVDEMIDMINKSVDRASEMIEMFRSQTRYSPLMLENVNLVEVVRKAVEEATPTQSIEAARARTQSIEAVLELEESLENVYVDGTKIHRVLNNLIQNAVEAMPTGGRLTVSAKRDGDKITLTVSDTGMGIPEDEAQHLFKPFHTTKEGGLGLGLYYCKRTIEAHEGTIELSSQVDEGTSFTIRIPVYTKDHLSQFESQAVQSRIQGTADLL